MKFTKKIKIDIPCPGCKTLNRVSLAQIQEKLALVCRGCHREVEFILKGDDLFQLDRTKSKFDNAVKNLNKKLKIKI